MHFFGITSEAHLRRMHSAAKRSKPLTHSATPPTCGPPTRTTFGTTSYATFPTPCTTCLSVVSRRCWRLATNGECLGIGDSADTQIHERSVIEATGSLSLKETVKYGIGVRFSFLHAYIQYLTRPTPEMPLA